MTPDTIYATDHPISKTICKFIEKGSRGRVVPPIRLQDGTAALYGILRGCEEIIKECEWIGRDYLHFDHGYFRRGHYTGYYRISRNGLQWSGPLDKLYPVDRWRALNVTPKPWRKSGRHVVVCPIASAVARFYGIDSHRWLGAVTAEIGRHTDRPVIVKPKDSDESLSNVLMDAWALVSFNSNAATEAVVHGVPVFSLGPSAARMVGRTHLSEIENPAYPDRDPWLHALAYQQWTLEEVSRGEPWEWV